MAAAGTAIVDEAAHAKENRIATWDAAWGSEDLMEQSYYSSLDCSLLQEEKIHIELI